MERIVVIGAGQQGRNCKRLALENGHEIVAFVDDFVTGEVEGIKVYKKIEDIDNYQSYKYIIAFGEIPPRRKYCAEMERLKLEGINLIDKTACIEPGARIGTGNYICKFTSIYASAVIGNNNIINCKAVIATDAVIGNNVNISMGKRMANVKITPPKNAHGSKKGEGKPSKWMQKVTNGELSWEEAEKLEEQELKKELGLR